jgi:PIN domain nuclease of toxin-antitoxin system/antitoxin (DNA-binding transcriptional repressor) of toxin-antitoxin stability system
VATVTIHQAKTHLSKLIARAEAGEEIVIARGKDPVVRLELVSARKPRPKFGAMKGIWPELPEAFFFDPLPKDELKLWKARVRLLLDTHSLVWFLTGDRKFSALARRAVEAPGTANYVSAATAWELATKIRFGKWPEATAIAQNIEDVARSKAVRCCPLLRGTAESPGSCPGHTAPRSTACSPPRLKSRA